MTRRLFCWLKKKHGNKTLQTKQVHRLERLGSIQHLFVGSKRQHPCPSKFLQTKKSKDLLLKPFIWDKELVLIHLQKPVISRNWSDIEQHTSPFHFFQKIFFWTTSTIQTGSMAPRSGSTWMGRTCHRVNEKDPNMIWESQKQHRKIWSFSSFKSQDYIWFMCNNHNSWCNYTSWWITSRKTCDCYKLHYRP